jgi:hypothetical protein
MKQTAREVNERLRSTFQSTLEREGSGAFAPMIIIGLGSGTELPVTVSGGAAEAAVIAPNLMYKIMIGLLSNGRTFKRSQVKYLVLAHDAYVETPPEDGKTLPPGTNFKNEFKEGNRTISEALMTTYVDSDGVVAARNTYRITATNEFEMDSPVEFEGAGFTEVDGTPQQVTLDYYFEPLTPLQAVAAVRDLHVPPEIVATLCNLQYGDDLKDFNDVIEELWKEDHGA